MPCEILEVDPKTIHRWAADGKLPVALRRPSGQLRFDPDEIEAIRNSWVKAAQR